MGGYSHEELYILWRDGFQGQHDETCVLMDFALCDKATAKALLRDFEATYSAQLLNLEHRGKTE